MEKYWLYLRNETTNDEYIWINKKFNSWRLLSDTMWTYAHAVRNNSKIWAHDCHHFTNAMLWASELVGEDTVWKKLEQILLMKKSREWDHNVNHHSAIYLWEDIFMTRLRHRGVYFQTFDDMVLGRGAPEWMYWMRSVASVLDLDE